MLFLVVLGGLRTAGVFLDLLPPKGWIYQNLCGGQGPVQFPGYLASTTASWCNAGFALAMLGGGLLLWQRFSRRVLIVCVLCAMACVLAGFELLESYFYCTNHGGVRIAALYTFVRPAGVCAAAVYVGYLVWRQRHALGRAVQLVGGGVAITGGTRAVAGLMFIPQYWGWYADSGSPWVWGVRWGSEETASLALLSVSICVLGARKGTGIAPASILLLASAVGVIGGLMPVLTGDLTSYNPARTAIRVAEEPVLALAFLLFALHYRKSPGGTYPVCASCGYNLTGNVSGRCPECGTPVPGAIVAPDTGAPKP